MKLCVFFYLQSPKTLLLCDSLFFMCLKLPIYCRTRVEGISLIYKATSWNKARRVAVIRKAQVFEDGQGRIVFDADWQYEAM